MPMHSPHDVAGQYCIVSNGERFEFTEFLNITQPCPECGVPACGKEDVLWYESAADEKIALIYDGAELDLLLEQFLARWAGSLASLPTFIRQWSECVGWEDCWDYHGFLLDRADFKAALQLLVDMQFEPWVQAVADELLTAMKPLLVLAEANNGILKIVRG